MTRRIKRTRPSAAATTIQIDPFGSFNASTTATPIAPTITTPPATDRRPHRRHVRRLHARQRDRHDVGLVGPRSPRQIRRREQDDRRRAHGGRQMTHTRVVADVEAGQSQHARQRG